MVIFNYQNIDHWQRNISDRTADFMLYTYLYKQRRNLLRGVIIMRDTIDHFNCIYKCRNSINHGYLEDTTKVFWETNIKFSKILIV